MSRDGKGGSSCPGGARGLSMPGNHSATLHLQPSRNHSALLSLDSWFTLCAAEQCGSCATRRPTKVKNSWSERLWQKKVNSEAGEQCGGGGRKLGCRICSDWWLLTWMGGVTCMTTNVIG